VQVKIIEFSSFCVGKGERALEELVNRGWQIVSSSGAGSFPAYIVILQREDPSGSVRDDRYDHRF
jgi:hypothetical protein